MTLDIESLQPGEQLPTRRHEPTNVTLFLYNAAVWNAHRIHYDEPYTTGVEGHPGIVIDGPLQGDWLAQCVTNWLGDDGVLETFEYSNRRAAHLGEKLESGGEIVRIDRDSGQVELSLWVRNEKGETTSPGAAAVRLRPPG